MLLTDCQEGENGWCDTPLGICHMCNRRKKKLCPEQSPEGQKETSNHCLHLGKEFRVARIFLNTLEQFVGGPQNYLWSFSI